MNQKLSIIIITKNRWKSLAACIASLQRQTHPYDELIIVDNNSSDGTQKYIRALQHKRTYVQYVRETVPGRAAARNAGVNAATGDWVIFIDDDCIAHPNWLEEFEKITRLQRAQVYIGRCKNLFTKNIFAVSEEYRENRWKRQRIKKDIVMDYEILDTKNITYNRTFLQKNKLLFNIELNQGMSNICEDCDFGLQIQAAGGVAIYAPRAVIDHKYDQDFIEYYKKIITQIFAHKILEKKWKQIYKTPNQYSRTSKQEINDTCLTAAQKILLHINLFCSHFFIIVVKICARLYI